MNLSIASITRLFQRSSRRTALRPERVEGIYLQPQMTGVATDEHSRSASGKNEVLVETTCAGCRNSAAATTLFVP